jgi:outer membrane protein TolC
VAEGPARHTRTRRRTACVRAAAIAALLGCGCGGGSRLGAVEKAIGTDRVLDRIDERIRDERRDAAGVDRWAQLAGTQYQDDAAIDRLRGRPDIERRRGEQAARMAAAGPLRLEACLSFALEFNDELQAARAVLKARAGEAVMLRSRFLPKLAYTVDNELTKENEDDDGNSIDDASHSFDHFLRLDQTIAEFGRQNSEEVTLRASARAALFAYEDAVRSTLSTARRRFFTILLRRQQVAERQKLLAEFQQRYEKMHRLERARRVLEVDVLTARLNVLNEEARINSLEREILREKIDLLRAIGFPVRMTDVRLDGSLEQFGMDLEAAVAMGLRRSTSVAQARAQVAEQLQVVREVGLRYGADLSANAGVKCGTTAAGVAFDTAEGLYSLGAFAEQHFQDEVAAWSTGNSTLNAQNPGWSADVRLKVPLFDGQKRRGAYLKERALLLQSAHELRSAVDAGEAAIRKAYYTMIERRKELEILEETVAISKERLRVKERQKELVGGISDNELETFRNRFFTDQDSFFRGQISLMAAQESLRFAMRYFEPQRPKESTPREQPQ